jgi:DNA replication protein DnaC
MNNTVSIDMILRSLNLSAIKREYKALSKRAETEGWSFTQYLCELLETEADERSGRRTQRLLKRSRLPQGKTMDTLDLKLIPAKVRRQIPALLEGGFVKRSENVLVFGLPGRGKTHLLAAIARELVVHKGYSVLFTSTHRLVEQLLIAKRDLEIEKLLKKLDQFDIVILDDIGYVQQSREEMEVLFTFLSERYERRSLMITSNLLFSEWDKIFKDPMTTAAAIDRLVHHSTILELDNDSYRAKEARKGKDKESTTS